MLLNDLRKLSLFSIHYPTVYRAINFAQRLTTLAILHRETSERRMVEPQTWNTCPYISPCRKIRRRVETSERNEIKGRNKRRRNQRERCECLSEIGDSLNRLKMLRAVRRREIYVPKVDSVLPGHNFREITSKRASTFC